MNSPRFMLKSILTAVIVALTLVLTSCDRDNNNTGYVYFPDMTYSMAYESYSQNPNFTDDMTLRKPVEGTVPRGYKPLNYTKDLADRERAGIELKNPLDYSSENLVNGEVSYKRNCLQCHGPKGDGQGHLYTSKLFTFPPASLVNDKVKNLPDGQIFHTITYGFGVMGAHGMIIQPDDRWRIILYIRKELQNQK